MNNKWRMFLISVPFIVLIFSAVFFQYLTQIIQNEAILDELHVIREEVNDIVSNVETGEFQENYICDVVERIDKRYQIYAAAYKYIDNELTLITRRFLETSPLEPTEYPEFMGAISQDSGGLIINYAPEYQSYRDMYLHFRWTPLNKPPEERYLIVTGASKHSVTSKIPVWASAGLFASMIVTFVFNVIFIILATAPRKQNVM